MSSLRKKSYEILAVSFPLALLASVLAPLPDVAADEEDPEEVLLPEVLPAENELLLEDGGIPPFPFMVHEALNVAPGSTESLETDTVPSITADDFRESKSETSSSPLNLPSMSAFTHSTFPFIYPSLPMTTFPEVLTLPSSLPSIRKSASDVISPLILVFFSILLGCPTNSFIVLGFLLSENMPFMVLGLTLH
jgi:hypothetical protein